MKTEVSPVDTELEDFKAAARTTFTKLKTVFAANDNYWRLGNSFDTVLNYFAWVPPNDTQAFGQTALERYKATSGPWWDDQGWWGIAGLRASQRSDWFGVQTAAAFKAIAVDCWTRMYDNAPYVWERRPKPGGNDKFGPLEPRFPNGVWNSNWIPNLGDCDATPKPCDPIDSCDECVCGFQNTVTNALYLVFATRLYLASRQPSYAEAANHEYAFLKQWFDVIPPENALLNRLIAGVTVVRERVSIYLSGQAVQGYRQDMAWAGDQGLILGGLVGRMLMVGRDSPEYPVLRATAQEILAGSRVYLTRSGIMQSWTPCEHPPDPEDYETGTGVFMRYLLYAYLNSDDLKAYLRGPQSGYLSFVRTNANHVLANPSPDTDMVGLTNELATLVAAVAMLGPTACEGDA